MKVIFLPVLGLIALTAVIQAAPNCENPEELNCYINHLKGIKKLPADFPEHPVNESSHLDCKKRLEEYQKEVSHMLALELRTNSAGKQTKCIMADLRAKNFADDNLKLKVYEASTSIKMSEKLPMLEEIIKKVVKTYKEALASCAYKQAMIESSEANVRSKNVDTGETKMLDYCGRKRIVELKLINTTVYNVILNPDNLDVEGVNCDAVLKAKIKLFVKLLYGLLNQDENVDKAVFDCFSNKFKDSKYYDRFLVLGTMADLVLSEEQKAKEVQKLADFMGELSDTVANCKTPPPPKKTT